MACLEGLSGGSLFSLEKNMVSKLSVGKLHLKKKTTRLQEQLPLDIPDQSGDL